MLVQLREVLAGREENIAKSVQDILFSPEWYTMTDSDKGLALDYALQHNVRLHLNADRDLKYKQKYIHQQLSDSVTDPRSVLFSSAYVSLEDFNLTQFCSFFTKDNEIKQLNLCGTRGFSYGAGYHLSKNDIILIEEKKILENLLSLKLTSLANQSIKDVFELINSSDSLQRNLEHLNLSGCDLSDATIASIFENSNFTNLKRLNISYNDVDIEGIKSIIQDENKFQNLEKIHIDMNPCSYRREKQFLINVFNKYNKLKNLKLITNRSYSNRYLASDYDDFTSKTGIRMSQL